MRRDMSLSNDHILSQIVNTTLYTLANADRFFFLGCHKINFQRPFPAFNINIYPLRTEPVHHTWLVPRARRTDALSFQMSNRAVFQCFLPLPRALRMKNSHAT